MENPSQSICYLAAIYIIGNKIKTKWRHAYFLDNIYWGEATGVVCDKRVSAQERVYKTVVRSAMLCRLKTLLLIKSLEVELEIA